MKSSERTLQEELNMINKMVSTLVEMKDQRNNYFTNRPQSLTQERIDAITTQLQTKIAEHEQKIIDEENRIAQRHPQYHPAHLTSPSFLEKREVPKATIKNNAM